MMAEVLSDYLTHIQTSCFCAEDADLEGLRLHEAQWRRGQRNDNRAIRLSLRLRDSEFAPRPVYGGVKKTKLEV